MRKNLADARKLGAQAVAQVLATQKAKPAVHHHEMIKTQTAFVRDDNSMRPPHGCPHRVAILMSPSLTSQKRKHPLKTKPRRRPPQLQNIRVANNPGQRLHYFVALFSPRRKSKVSLRMADYAARLTAPIFRHNHGPTTIATVIASSVADKGFCKKIIQSP
jgi:hypothetical protein